MSTSAAASAAVAVLLSAVTATAAPAAAPDVAAGPLAATVTAKPWRLTLRDRDGRTVLRTSTGGTTAGPGGALGFQAGGHWYHATRATAVARRGKAITATLATNDPAHRTLRVTVARDADGVIALHATVAGGALGAVTATGAGFQATTSERYLGFGERSNAVNQRGGTVDNYVAEGPYVGQDNDLLKNIIPPPGWNQRDDTTYFPMPWLLSTRGYGVLVDDDERSLHHLDAKAFWSVEVAAAHLDLRVFAGPRPADALRRMTARVGRQPKAAAPFFFGPWFQPPDDIVKDLATLRAADSPTSLAMTYAHYLPCGVSADGQVGDRARAQAAHDAGMAVTTYFNPMICTTNPAYDPVAAAGGLGRDATGAPYVYPYFTSRRFDVSQFDFSSKVGVAQFAGRLSEAYANGHDGWMEDFGEYTPADLVSADGTPGTAMHNRYPTLYHRAGYGFAKAQSRPLARFNRSGWTGTAASSQVVWGGDPTTDWGFDGLASAVRNGLSMGLSGVSLWGSDIGGYFTINGPQLTPELLRRWVQFGFASGVMRTETDGLQVGEHGRRPQVLDDDVLPVWRRYAKLRTQLYPYLAAAQQEYDRTGLPLMRALALAYPTDATATGRDDEYLFGPDLLAAPVLAPGATTRRVYLPGDGHWVDVWRSVGYDTADGSFSVKGSLLLKGGRSVTLPAPADELPLLAKAGTVLPLLPADVQTLSTYGAGDPSIVHLADRSAARRLLAFPRGTSDGALGPDGERWTSIEGARSWTLRLDGSRSRAYDIQAALGALTRSWNPCRVTLAGRALPASAWHWDTDRRVLRITATLRRGTITASTCR